MSNAIPAEASETLVFTPADLEVKMEKPPRFRLRAVSTREKRHFDRLLTVENVRQHGTEDFRAEMLRGLAATATPDSAAELEPRVKAFWEALDEHNKEQAELPQDERTDFDHPDRERIEDLGQQIARAWQPLREMTADNQDANTMLPLVSIAVVVSGWDHLDAMFAKDSGFLTIDSAESVCAALRKLDEANGVSPGLSWLQLCAKAMGRIFLSKEQEKNSASPSPSSNPPSNTKTDGKGSPAGQSQASAISTETPAN
ncbi:MAG: hypothetical protein ACT6Q7_02885 [Blastomonas fulva]|uniref:hypothetical protein n=1 Tax=Blastomonas fulva TaxID=1550728 RepID=UPI00403398B2